MYACRCLGSICGSLALGLAPGGVCEDVNKENEEVLLFIDMSPSFRFRAHRRMHRTWKPQRLLSNAALLFRLLGALVHFPCQPQIQVRQSPLESPPLALKPPSQAAVLRVDADTASRQVKHEGLEVTVPISFLHFHPDDPSQ